MARAPPSERKALCVSRVAANLDRQHLSKWSTRGTRKRRRDAYAATVDFFASRISNHLGSVLGLRSGPFFSAGLVEEPVSRPAQLHAGDSGTLAREFTLRSLIRS